MSNQITPSPYNPVHFVYLKQIDPSFHFKDIYDDLFQNRVDRYRINIFYAQKWQKSDSIRLQFITEGIAQLEAHMADMNGKDYAVEVSTTVSNPAVVSPYSLKQFDIPLTDYPVGCYQINIYANGVKLMKSEWQQVSVSLPETLAFDYSHTTNKLNGYFTSFNPRVRIEGFLQSSEPDFTTTHYRDEPGDSETLYGVVTRKRVMKIGNDFGCPDYMHLLICRILMLNRVNIEGMGYSLTDGAKIKIDKLDDYPLYYSSFDIEPAKNRDMAVTDAALPVSINLATVNIDAQSVGIGTGVTQIQITD